MLSVLALSVLTGCASQPDVTATDETIGAYAGVVSAREYGYVRPARDVVVRDRTRAVVERGSSGDVWHRVRSGMRLDLQANARIDSTLERFRRDPRYLEKMSQRASPYLATIVAEIERRGFPMELALLPHVESRYNPSATSPKAAAGMWQFMPYTAREMGLRLDGQTDERRDVAASTRAAMDYLEMLNKRFDGDWELAMAAYNCGPGCVESARAANRRNGKPTDFWSLDLPNETEQYVPQILAAAKLVAEARRYGQRLPAIPDQGRVDVILASRPMNLVKVALANGVELGELKRLNPDVKLGTLGHPSIKQLRVPGGAGSRISATSPLITLESPSTSAGSRLAVRVYQRQPAGASTESLGESRAHIVRNGETLASIALRHGLDLKTLAELNGLSPRDPLLPGQTLNIPDRKAPDLVTHRVRQGDSISTLAHRYGVSIADIRRWNNLADRRLKPGDTLRIYRRDPERSSS